MQVGRAVTLLTTGGATYGANGSRGRPSYQCLHARRREAWSRPGVYFLSAPGSHEERGRLCVGEADDVREGVDNHVKDQEF